MPQVQVLWPAPRCPPGYPNRSLGIYYRQDVRSPPSRRNPRARPAASGRAALPDESLLRQSARPDLPTPPAAARTPIQPSRILAGCTRASQPPVGRFLQSVVYHVLAFALLIAFTRFFALQPQVVAKPAFDSAQVIYYTPSEYLPPLDTRDSQPAEPAKTDPELSPQPIISVPPEADNRLQTIVTPPNIKLKHDVALPNVVASSDKLEKPQLDVPPIPLTPAAEITRITPQFDNAVVKPPPDAADLVQRRNLSVPQRSVVAPPPDVSASNAAAFQGLQPALIAPPPSIDSATRSFGELNIGPSSVIAPAPRLPVAEQRAVAGSLSSRAGVGSSQVVAPPPSLSASGSSSRSFGAPGRIIALNLHSAVG